MATAGPAWKNLKGMRRVQAEFKHLSADIEAKKFGFVKELSLVDDNMLIWQLKLHNFDNDLPGGKQLNQDLRRLNAMYGQDHILMQIEFPRDYPHQPFFVRLVSPRCQMYTGHVTAGGSICLESLTCSGTPGSWQPDFSVESLLNVIVINMVDCPVTYVQTATGPGGRSGPLRIDFACGNPTMGYSSAEARAAFHRTLENHKRMGWGGTDTAGPSGGAAGAGSSAAAAAAAAAGMPSRLGTKLPGAGMQNQGYGGWVAAAAAAAAVAAQPARVRRRAANAAAAAAGVGAVAADDDPAAAAAAPASAGQRSSKRQKLAATAGVARTAAAAAATQAQAAAAVRRLGVGTSDVVDLCESDDDDAALAAALKASMQQTSRQQGQVATSAPPPPPPSPPPAAAAAVACLRRRVPAHAGASPGQHAVIVSDNDGSDIDEVLTYHNQHVRQQQTAAQAAATGAAAAAAARGSSRPQQQAAGRQRARQSDDVVMIVDSQDDNDVQLVGSPAHPAAAAAAAGAPAARSSRRQAIQQQQHQAQQPRPQAVQPTQQRRWQQLQQQQQPPAPPAPRQPLVQPVVVQQVVADGAAAPRVQVELEYPAHWDYSQPIQTSTVRLVELPLHGQSLRAPPQDPLEAAAAAQQLSQAAIDMLLSQGLSLQDALAALLLAEGDVEEALMRATMCLELGGTAKMWRDMQPVEVLDVDAANRQQEEAAAAARRIAEEVEGVLAHLEATGGNQVTRSKVLKIERVQNARLWKRYCLKRAELLEAHGQAGLNERVLFHGTNPGTVDVIAQTGFDFRLVSYSSAYGNGLYFADHSITAWGYCQKPDMNAAAGMPVGMAWGGMPPPPFVPGMAQGGAAGGGIWSGLGGMMPGTMAAALNPYGVAGGVAGTGRPVGKRGRGSAAIAVQAAAQVPQGQRVYKMLVARVALGRQATGQHGMRKPPDGYDSVNSGSAAVPGAVVPRLGNVGRGRSRGQQQQQLYYCHVVFDNDQCVPKYVITLRA